MSSLRILVLVAVLSLLGLGGCESMRNSVSAHFTRAPVVHTVDGTLPRVFAAATASLKAMNYEIRRSRAREGVLEAASPVYAERGPNICYKSRSRTRAMAAAR
jgi:hypothetical protein